MSISHKKLDANTPAIINALHDLGWQWVDTHQLGDGFGDGIAVYREDDGTWQKILVEIKMPGEKLTAAERKFHERFLGLVKIWRCAEDVIRDTRGGMA